MSAPTATDQKVSPSGADATPLRSSSPSRSRRSHRKRKGTPSSFSVDRHARQHARDAELRRAKNSPPKSPLRTVPSRRLRHSPLPLASRLQFDRTLDDIEEEDVHGAPRPGEHVARSSTADRSATDDDAGDVDGHEAGVLFPGLAVEATSQGVDDPAVAQPPYRLSALRSFLARFSDSSSDSSDISSCSSSSSDGVHIQSPESPRTATPNNELLPDQRVKMGKNIQGRNLLSQNTSL